jgi:hypothetical protein
MRQAKQDSSDTSFLSVARAGSGDAIIDGTKGSASTDTHTAATPNNGTASTVAAAATNSLTPTRNNTSTSTAPLVASYSDADNAFLRAMRGEPEQTSAPKSNTEKSESIITKSASDAEPNRSDADNEFLRAFRGEPEPSKQPYPTTIAQAAEPRHQHNFRDEHVGTKKKTPPNDDMAHANAAFLGALHASTDPPDDAMPLKGGTFVLDAKHHPKGLQGQGESSGGRSDADSAFLLAMRGSSQSSMNMKQPSQTSFGGTEEYGGSGTLILNAPKKKIEESSFVMSIQASDDSQMRGMSLEDLKEDTNAVSDAEEEEDDVEGMFVPSHPYIEKIMLPRPLFFGNRLPPRIIEEAEQAAKTYTSKPDFPKKDDEVGTSTKDLFSESAINESDEGSVHTGSTMSSFSTVMGGGKLFEPRVLPCARNFEGALETFGFGHNPFHTNLNEEPREDSVDCNDLPKTPHPYVSIYSPVWGDRARSDRARTRRKKAKLEGTDAKLAKDTSNKSYKGMNSEWDSKLSNSLQCDPREGISAEVLTGDQMPKTQTPAADANDLFLSHLKSSSLVDLPPQVSDNDFSRDQFAMFARGDAGGSFDGNPGQDKKEEANDFSRDQFAMFARSDQGGSFDGSPVAEKKQVNSDDFSRAQFAMFARGDEGGSLDESSVAEKKEQGKSDDFSRDQFAMFARGDQGGSFDGSPVTEKKPINSDNFSRDQFCMLARGDDAGGTFVGRPTTEKKQEATNDFSSRDQFCMFARGDAVGGTFNEDTAPVAEKVGTFVANKPRADFKMDSSTFVQAVKSGDAESDDDSIDATEERKAVGVNDNMAAAAAMLAGEDADDEGDDNAQDGAGKSIFVVAGGGAKAANKFGRPYSNLELTGGCVPRFSCDEPSLPHESDLGVFETKEEEKRTNERRKEKNIIEDMTVPGIMPIVRCPTQCTDVDDSQSWNARNTESEGNNRKSNNTVLISLDGNKSPTSSGCFLNGKATTYEASRIGWWNLPDGFDENSSAVENARGESKEKTQRPSPAIEVFPASDDPIPLDVITNLWPSAHILRNNNISAAHLHSATSSARFMPHLSDRNPNFRHLQIDTTAVGFPKLGGEVEPMFCKLAIYHFEVNAPFTDQDIDDSVASTISSSLSVTSLPNRDRCGPVTETLNFDVVQDQKVIERCKRAIWPYASEAELNQIPGEIVSDDVMLEGSPCGVFPLPSHLPISNLYAVLLVHKVVSDVADQQPYFKPSRRDKSGTTQKEEVDLSKLRDNASKAAETYGQLITPIAFGVLPLMQIVGNEDSPKQPVTRVVQIPLFKFEQGRGTDIILDHILGMLHPRANPKIGKVASMTRGHAFLVMRYFGFLGLHSIISKTKMARHRLVDFTRELQVKRGGDSSRKGPDRCPIGDPYILPPWRQQYLVEPAHFGGRIISTELRNSPKTSVVVTSPSLHAGKEVTETNNNSSNVDYAQELAALPLENSGAEKSSRRSSKSTDSSKFECLLFHTSFCNELICQPKILANCPNKNIVIKVEMREMRWDENLKVEVAIPMSPSIHNPRRGPWLVKDAYTSCALKTANPQFLDEFKIKLPLVLGESWRVVLFFSVYHVHIQKKSGSLLKASTRRSIPDATELGGMLQLIGSGILPLTTDESPSCLLSNGEHKVPIHYRVLDDPADRAKGLLPSSKPQHQSKLSTGSIGSVVKHLRSRSGTMSVDTLSADDEATSAHQDLVIESLSYPQGSVFLECINEGELVLNASDDNNSIKSDSKANLFRENPESGMSPSLSSGNLQQLGSAPKHSSDAQKHGNLVLKVNIIVFSSVHPQSRVLANLFSLKPDLPRCVKTGDFSGLSPWGKHRSEILYRLKPERIPPFHFVGGALAESERKLLDPVVSLSKTSKCPAYDVIPHLLRIISQLWRTAVSGIGEPSLLWASPESLIPLRLNAFASLLHVVSTASHYMAKAGLTLLDGDKKWNLSALSKTLSLLFDEFRIFEGPLEPLLQKEGAKKSSTNPNGKKSPLIKKPLKLARSKTSNEMMSSPKPTIIQRFSSEEAKPPTSLDLDAILSSSQSYESNSVEEHHNSFTSSKDMGFKVDTRNDFMSAMREAAAIEDAEDTGGGGGNSRISSHLMNSSGSNFGPGPSRRRFFTLPAMATIVETDAEAPQESSVSSPSPNQTKKKVPAADTDLILHADRSKRKQMRIPQVSSVDNTSGITDFLDSLSIAPPTKSGTDSVTTITAASSLESSENKKDLPVNNDVIERSGTAFLDRISQSFGALNTGKDSGIEARRLGAAHHRKTRSRCSIDWTLPPTDMLLEKDQQIEQHNRSMAGATTAPITMNFDDMSTDDETIGNDSADEECVIENQDPSSIESTHPLKKQEKDNDAKKACIETLLLPDFAHRMNLMKDDGKPKRWWPYVYEVIIYQWLALLVEQTKKGDINKSGQDLEPLKPTLSPIVTKYLSHAAKAARGATIRCAPYLLEIIKQSLSWRIDILFRDRKKKRSPNDAPGEHQDVPQLVKLDESILAAIEKLITMLTDASIDSRNFDSFEFRKISIDVNDAVIRFLRDLFSMLDLPTVHRLVMVYFSRFVTKEGKHWHDRDSKTTGLRCSWETTKLRLNAITLFVRFPDFMKVNMPLMERERWEAARAGSSAASMRRFYSHTLEKITRLNLGEITSPEGPISKEPVKIPKLKPHWLAELATDILLAATGHAEEGIQLRASSLLLELIWNAATEGRASGNVSVVASVFVPLVPKVLVNIEYLSSLPGKCQLRKDIIPCVLFVFQSAPVGLMRALWRKLAKQAEGKTQQKDSASKFGGFIGMEGQTNAEADSTFAVNSHNNGGIYDDGDEDDVPDLYDIFGLLNLALSTIEYDGCETKIFDTGKDFDESDENPSWRREFLLSPDRGYDQMITTIDQRKFPLKNGLGNDSAVGDEMERESTHNARRWYAHDCSIVIIHTCRQIVRETLGMLKPSMDSETDFEDDPTSIDFQGSRTFDELSLAKTTSSSIDNVDSGNILEEVDEGRYALKKKHRRKLQTETLTFSMADTIIFVRGATSVYLHALTMRQSDVAVVKTLTATIEIVKIFGIKVFLNAVGQTLQHWIRVTLEHCGARRAEVRVDASEFLNLLLRLTWDSYGSFFRIRLPLLSVQTEVMERIVAKAASKYEKEQKSLRLNPVKLSTEFAEASLAPLWRTIDRFHFQSASLNLSYKSALARLAIMMKKLYKAYLSVHALTLLTQSEERETHSDDIDTTRPESNSYTQRMRVSVHRIVSNAAGYSRQLLGIQASAHLDLSCIQSETVEDSLFMAADVFSATELPTHRFAFLEKLAEFHRLRSRFAEEATCRLHIYHTFREAAKQHENLWSSSPFLPWASNQSDELQPENQGPSGGAFMSDMDYDDILSVNSAKHLDKNTSFRRIFYRAADSVLVRTGDWAGFGGGKFLFYGITLKSEFNASNQWFTLRDMEDAMVSQVEAAGELFLRSGIVESSRHAYNLATYFYSETFNYSRLAHAYRKLARVVTSKIPVVDTSNQFDMSSQIGRFYKVYFHGSAPDDLLHTQGSEGFIYRVPSSVGIKEFASRLEISMRSIAGKSSIDLVLDDGSPTVGAKSAAGKRQLGIGGAPSEPIKIKVTPLRPLFRIEDTEKCFRGTPEWFQLKTDEYDSILEAEAQGNAGLHQRQISVSTANTLSSSGSTTISNRRSSFLSNYRNTKSHQRFSSEYDKESASAGTIGVDRFYFTQPAKKDPVRGFRDWLKVPTGSFAERSLRVTELQVKGAFPACVTRQKIIHRAIFSQSPLEAGVEAVSTWCSLLFRTIMATNGLRVLSEMTTQEEGLNIICVAKVLADCIHSSGVKQIGLSFLSTNMPENNNSETGFYSTYERLSEDEVEKVQTKLARIIVTFLELLHLLIARNRDVLLAVVQSRKRRGADTASVASGSHEVYSSRPGHHSPTKGGSDHSGSQHRPVASGTDFVGKSINTSNQLGLSHKVSGSDRTDAAIGVQSELQRGFISLVRALSPKLLDAINAEVPRWMRQCVQENYFSSGLYRQADIPIGEELFFNMDTNGDRGGIKDDSSVPISISRGCRGSSPGNSVCGTETSDGRRSEIPASTVSVQSTSRSRHRDNVSGGSTSFRGGF